ncbi:hypothetical protein LXL04_018642 [Taraxacum kok-saghyz]
MSTSNKNLHTYVDHPRFQIPCHLRSFQSISSRLRFVHIKNFLISISQEKKMNDVDVSKQIQQMVAFIRQEAEEKANEISVSSEEEFNIEKMQIVDTEKKKIKQDYERKTKQVDVKKKIEYSMQLNASRIKVLQAQDDLVIGMKNAAAKELLNVSHNKKTYRNLMKSLIVQGLQRLNERAVLLRCREVDLSLVESTLEDAKKDYFSKAKVDVRIELDKKVYLPPPPSNSDPNRVVLASIDGKIVFENTLDARLDLAFRNKLPEMNDVDVSKQIQQMVAFIRQEAEEKANEISVSSEEEFNIEKMQIVDTEKKKIKQDYERKTKQVDVKKKIEYSMQLNASRIKVLQAQDDLVIGMKNAAAKELLNVSHNKKTYRNLMKSLIVQGLQRLNERAVLLRCREVDLSLVESTLEDAKRDYFSKAKVDVRIELDKKVCGGVVLASIDGKIVFENTLDARLDLAFRNKLPEIRKTLFKD